MRSHETDRDSSLLELARQVKACRRCPGMNVSGKTEAAPGYGSATSPVMIIGQSLCGPCMETQIPFTGGCGLLLDAAFERAGVAKASLFITNVVHCHPPNNRSSYDHEIASCLSYLDAELSIVRPRVAIGLGKDARSVLGPMEQHHRDTRFRFFQHPSYIRRRPPNEREAYIEDLATLIREACAAARGVSGRGIRVPVRTLTAR